MVVWIIGLSGAGKTTLATEVVRRVREHMQNVVLLDGDVIREVFGNDLGHDLAGRRRNAERICRLGQLLDQQGIHVVCAILSLFPESRSWNRQHLRSYYEVFIDAPMSELEERDPKGIYQRARRGEISQVAGIDLAFPVPTDADLIIPNNNSLADLLNHAELICDRIMGAK